MSPSDFPEVAPIKDNTVTALQNWISPSPGGSDVATPIRVRACHAWHAMLRGRRPKTVSGPNLMRRGAERC